MNFYNWSNYMAPGVLEDFTRGTGIKVVYDTFDANETLETRLLAGKSGYDVVVPTGYFLQRQITAKVFHQARQVEAAEPRPMPGRGCEPAKLATYDPGNNYAANFMWGTTGIGYNVKTAPENSWDQRKDRQLGYRLQAGELLEVQRLRHPHAGLRRRHSGPPRSAISAIEPELHQAGRSGKSRRNSSARSGPTSASFIPRNIWARWRPAKSASWWGWSGDIMQARSRAAEAKNGIENRLHHSKGGRADVLRQSRDPRRMRRTSRRPMS